MEAQRRKRNELIGEMLTQGKAQPAKGKETATLITNATRIFIEHIKAHSPSKPKTPQRYQQVMNHFERLLGHKKYVGAISRADIDDYKVKRSEESSSQHDRPITARTINFEVGTLRTFFYYLINDRGLPITNPCARFKHLKDERKKAKSRPQPYTQEELDRLFTACDEKKKAIFATLLLMGLRKRELYFLAWRDVDLKAAAVRVSGDGKEGFSPKDYEERIIPIPPDPMAILEKLPRNTEWVFTNYKGGHIGHRISRWEGGLFFGYYIAYTIYLILTATRHHLASQFRVVMLWFVIPLTVVTLLIFVYRTARANNPRATSAPGASQAS